MRAITLDQPYATLIAELVKWIETRPKRPPWHCAVGETIAIHAGKRAPEHMTLGDWEVGRLDPGAPRRLWSTVRHDAPIDLPLGAIVATAKVDAVVPMTSWSTLEGPPVTAVYVEDGMVLLRDSIGADGLALPPDGGDGGCHNVTDQIPFGDFAPGRWAILLSDIRQLREPVHDIGGFHRGLWTVPDGDVERINAQLAA